MAIFPKPFPLGSAMPPALSTVGLLNPLGLTCKKLSSARLSCSTSSCWHCCAAAPLLKAFDFGLDCPPPLDLTGGVCTKRLLFGSVRGWLLFVCSVPFFSKGNGTRVWVVTGPVSLALPGATRCPAVGGPTSHKQPSP